MSTRAEPRAASARAAPTAPSRRAVPKTVARRRRLLLVAAVITALLAVGYGVTRSPLLAVDALRVHGTSHLTRAQVLDAAGVHEGDPMVWLDTSAAVDGMEALPYVRSARLVREWPDTVRITVVERTVVAWIEAPGGTALVDRSGVVLQVVDAAPAALPQLVGATRVSTPGSTIDAVGAARVAGALSGLAAAGTRSVDVTDQGIVMHLASGPEVRLGEATQIAVKVRAALAVLGASGGVPVQYVDVSVPSNPVTG